MGVAGGEKSEDEHLLAILPKRGKKKSSSGFGWLAGIETRHRFSDQSDIKPT